MRLATGGTLLACRLALEHGVAINLGGGFHHAASDWVGASASMPTFLWRQRSFTGKGASTK